jgi:hypothetical protein
VRAVHAAVGALVRRVVVRHRVPARINDIVEVPPVRLVAASLVHRRRVPARLARLVGVHRRPLRRPRPFRDVQPVATAVAAAEVVLHPVQIGDPPVLP